MKKNFLWMLAALFACGVMTTSCTKNEEIIPLDPNSGQTPSGQDEKPVRPVSLLVKYEASATQAIVANYNQVATSVLVRYVDADGTVKSEPFTGSFSKSVTIPITATGMDAAFQVLIVPKSKAEIEALGTDVDVTTTMKFTCVVNYDNNTKSEEIVFSTDEGFCAPRRAVVVADYDRYVPRFGGFVPAMVQLGYYIEELENYRRIVGPIYDAAGFWREHAYTAQ